MVWGVAKTKKTTWKCSKLYSWFIHKLSSKFYLVDIFENPHKNQAKSKIQLIKPLIVPHIVKTHQNQAFQPLPNPKIKLPSHKNLPTNPKSSLFIGTFTDNVFSPQNRPNHLSSHSIHMGGYSKTTHKTTPIRE